MSEVREARVITCADSEFSVTATQTTVFSQHRTIAGSLFCIGISVSHVDKKSGLLSPLSVFIEN